MKKKILILGASSDIGIITTIKFLDNNWKVVAHYNQNQKKLFKLKKKYKSNLEILKINLNNTNNLKKNLIKKKDYLTKLTLLFLLLDY